MYHLSLAILRFSLWFWSSGTLTRCLDVALFVCSWIGLHGLFEYVAWYIGNFYAISSQLLFLSATSFWDSN